MPSRTLPFDEKPFCFHLLPFRFDGADVSTIHKIEQIISPFSSHNSMIIIKSLKAHSASNIGPISKATLPKQMGMMFLCHWVKLL